VQKLLRLLASVVEGEEGKDTIQQHNSHLTSSVGLATVAAYEREAVGHLLSFADSSSAGGAARDLAVDFLRATPSPLLPLLASFQRIDERSLRTALAVVLQPDISSNPTSLLGSISSAFITYGNLHAQNVTGLPTFSIYLAALLRAMDVAGHRKASRALSDYVAQLRASSGEDLEGIFSHNVPAFSTAVLRSLTATQQAMQAAALAEAVVHRAPASKSTLRSLQESGRLSVNVATTYTKGKEGGGSRSLCYLCVLINKADNTFSLAGAAHRMMECPIARRLQEKDCMPLLRQLQQLRILPAVYLRPGGDGYHHFRGAG
jgi:hypothetical protein